MQAVEAEINWELKDAFDRGSGKLVWMTGILFEVGDVKANDDDVHHQLLVMLALEYELAFD